MNDTAFIFGAGKTGRGFAGHLAFLGGYKIILVDKNLRLVEDLKKANQYDIQVLNNDEMSCTINVSGVYDIEDISWYDDFILTSLVFTSVFGNNLEELAKKLAKVLQDRYIKNTEQLLTIITCENLINAAGVLKNFIAQMLDEKQQKWLTEKVGFSEAIIFKTCLDAGADQAPLTVRAQNLFKLPCDGDEIKQMLHVYGLEPLNNFKNQLRRKIYTYNCINAVISYLGAKKGFSQLHEAGTDEEILAVARQAATETCRAQVAEFGFDAKEQEEWVNTAFLKFSDRNIPDLIERNGADPVRKLGRDDRLIGPALLAMKHGIHPEGLLTGIMACFDYRDQNTKVRVWDIIQEKGIDYVLKEICGLSTGDDLHLLIKKEIIQRNPNGKN